MNWLTGLFGDPNLNYLLNSQVQNMPGFINNNFDPRTPPIMPPAGAQNMDILEMMKGTVTSPYGTGVNFDPAMQGSSFPTFAPPVPQARQAEQASKALRNLPPVTREQPEQRPQFISGPGLSRMQINPMQMLQLQGLLRRR